MSERDPAQNPERDPAQARLWWMTLVRLLGLLLVFGGMWLVGQAPQTGGPAGGGLMLMAAACFNPAEAVPLWQRMGQLSGGQNPPEFASTHPSPETRIQNLQALMPKAQQYRQKYCSGSGAAGSR